VGSLLVRRDPPVAHVVLSRPEVRNAFNAELIGELHRTFDELSGDPELRAIVLAGEGKTFCGGADIAWMRASLELTLEENLEDARRLSRMLRAIDSAPQLVIARVQGAALGGGSGLVAACDIAIAAENAVFGFTETKLGLLPATISPFVLAKIGLSHARAVALTGERFSAQRAERMGLVHVVVPEEELDGAVEVALKELRSAGPSAVARTKAIFARVADLPYDDTLEPTASAIASQRISDEGQEGLRAFLEKRRPSWSE